MQKAFIFPGQGSQAVGMGKALFDAFEPARAVFAEVDDALSQPLSKLMFEGPESELTLTANAQPALMAVSLAAIRALEAECGLDLARDAAFVAGHSLGEYSALAAAGALTISDTARLLRIRGDAMQKAVPVGEGAMAALLGAELDQARAVAEEAATAANGVCQVANDNGGGQVVISGAKSAVDKAIDIAKEKGIKRALLLPVSAPFHCALMQPAADAMREALAGRGDQRPVRSRRRQCDGGADAGPGGDSPTARRAGHRRGALARMRGLYGESRRDEIRRMRLGQGSRRAVEADRAAGSGHFSGRARRFRRLSRLLRRGAGRETEEQPKEKARSRGPGPFSRP